LRVGRLLPASSGINWPASIVRWLSPAVVPGPHSRGGGGGGGTGRLGDCGSNQQNTNRVGRKNMGALFGPQQDEIHAFCPGASANTARLQKKRAASPRIPRLGGQRMHLARYTTHGNPVPKEGFLQLRTKTGITSSESSRRANSPTTPGHNPTRQVSTKAPPGAVFSLRRVRITRAGDP